MRREIITTEDGSRTIHLPDMDEHYHSIFGARTESEHIFIKHALERRLSEPYKGTIQLLEIGFGTGLNAWLTLMHQVAHTPPYTIRYITYELYPIENDIISELFQDYFTEDDWCWMKRLHDAEWGKEIKIADGFTLLKVNANLTESSLPIGNDVIYMDAFAPEKTPELWSPSFLQRLSNSASQGGWLSTYCAKGIVRRTLQNVGFEVYRTPGPPHGKREILTAKKQ
ncbi:tRNA (5-methylaminomethyl-2-thiouridine)(34)-methyltransferase MnmD [Porphyromonadaceae bacterium W3.11]|nr:tRNA (5-methylaminomethyl-2-thiouridine)(34)-methyltransferase MnmD [Porphyromonadaceae bacterium W3.11]